MDFDIVLRSRHSTRVFTEKPVPKDELEAVVADAQRAPSWVNAQEWEAWIATGRTMKCIRDEYLAMGASHVPGRSDIPPVPRTAWSRYAQKRMAEFNDDIAAQNLGPTMARVQDVFYNAPAVVFLTVPTGSPAWALLDLGAFEQTLLLSATNRGLGSIPSWNAVKYPQIIRKHMGIPGNQDIVVGIALGYEADDPINRLRTSRELTRRILTLKD